MRTDEPRYLQGLHVACFWQTESKQLLLEAHMNGVREEKPLQADFEPKVRDVSFWTRRAWILEPKISLDFPTKSHFFLVLLGRFVILTQLKCLEFVYHASLCCECLAYQSHTRCLRRIGAASGNCCRARCVLPRCWQFSWRRRTPQTIHPLVPAMVLYI